MSREPSLIARRAFYSDSIAEFLGRTGDEILGILTRATAFDVELSQRSAWLAQIELLREALGSGRWAGRVHFEFDVPRMGKRVDVVVVIEPFIFVIEFKVGESSFSASARDQVLDYALDLRHFHETSHACPIVPVLVATNAAGRGSLELVSRHGDDLFEPLLVGRAGLREVFAAVAPPGSGSAAGAAGWEAGRYSPTPTIIEAARALFNGHGVAEISRTDAAATNLTETSAAVNEIVDRARAASRRAICFVTGVPGAGKTLVGLKIATERLEGELHSVFLSGNGPLVAVLREALARDRVDRERHAGGVVRKERARSEVKAFIQNVHHFRDECLRDGGRPPVEHVALFDEAQRAWNREKTASFMQRRKGLTGFDRSEPEFLISCMDRHADWAVVVCLVGGGQEINTGEAGIVEWIDALDRGYPAWEIHLSPRLHDSEYGAGAVLERLEGRPRVHLDPRLHLGVSMRSFRAERVSEFVKAVLDTDQPGARRLLGEIGPRYPIVLSRDVDRARRWLRHKARGTERCGLVASSRALRLKPRAIDVRVDVDPVRWFLGPKEDVRSSFYLEDAATEFDVQGLELDWVGVVWDGDLRYREGGWEHHSFVGDRWNRMRKPERRGYLKNAYRVLLTRARQGMVIVVPDGDGGDATRSPEFYDETFQYLRGIGVPLLD